MNNNKVILNVNGLDLFIRENVFEHKMGLVVGETEDGENITVEMIIDILTDEFCFDDNDDAEYSDMTEGITEESIMALILSSDIEDILDAAEGDLLFITMHHSFMEGLKEIPKPEAGQCLQLKVPLLECPYCDGYIYYSNRRDNSVSYYTCSNTKDTCNVFITEKICGHKLSFDEVSLLLERERTPIINDFISKNGKKFPSYLELRDGKPYFLFPEKIKI